MIQDYSELVIEFTTRCEDSSLIKRAGMIVGFAEADLSRRLRVGSMEATTTLTTDADGKATLPVDLEVIRTISLGSYPLKGVTLERLDAGYDGFAMQGGEILTSCASADITINYYAKIPSLETAGVNWLLTEHPEMYLFACIKHGYLANMDAGKADLAEAYLKTLIGEFSVQDRNRRYSKTPLTIDGMTP